MSFSEIYSISEFGLDVERTRLKAAALNIANQNTIYDHNSIKNNRNIGSVEVSSRPTFIDTLNKTANITYYYDGNLRSVYKPEHAAADQNGMIHMPKIDISQQMITLTSAERAYDANVKVINTIYSMAQKTMELGNNR